jgi:Protein of unknown function (DUF3106)
MFRAPLKWLFLTAGLLALSLPASANQPGALQALQTPPPADQALGHGGKGKLARILTPEQRVLFMADARGQTKDMTRDQRRAWRKDQIQKITAMSPTERQAFQSGLQARWDALPPARKSRIEQRLAQRETPPPAR